MKALRALVAALVLGALVVPPALGQPALGQPAGPPPAPTEAPVGPANPTTPGPPSPVGPANPTTPGPPSPGTAAPPPAAAPPAAPPPAAAPPAGASPTAAPPAPLSPGPTPGGTTPAFPPPGGTSPEAPLPADAQQVTVYLRGLPAGGRALVQRGDEAPVEMKDPGLGVLTAQLRGPPARFLSLRLLLEAGGAQRALYDGLVVLGGRPRETVAFQYQDQAAVRLPVSPSARIEVALDQRVPWWVSFGWGALALGWVGMLGIVWAIRSR